MRAARGDSGRMDSHRLTAYTGLKVSTLSALEHGTPHRTAESSLERTWNKELIELPDHAAS